MNGNLAKVIMGAVGTFGVVCVSSITGSVEALWGLILVIFMMYQMDY